MKKIGILLFVLLSALALFFFACGDEGDEEEDDCPRFSDYQIYPEFGTATTEYELLVVLKKKSVNHKVNRIEAKLFNSDGSSAQKTLDMVQSNEDPYRFVRGFSGSDVCEEGTCHLYFHVIAYHTSGCEKAFDTQMLVVEVPTTIDDDDAES